ncbi:MAG TPA: glycosyltransferase 61 family protein [Ideonella sp.]|nr:glycosyltransferase 61 family protein [Ideonella sp.]
MEEIVAAANNILTLCRQQGWALADEAQLEREVAKAHDKRETLAKVLQAFYLAALNERSEALPPQAMQAFESGAAAVWRGQSAAERLASGLYPRWATLLGQQGRLPELTELMNEFALQLGMPNCAPLAAALLRQFRRLKAWPQSLRLVELLAPTWRSGRAWAGEFAVALALLARETPALGDLGRLRNWSAPLLRALALPALDPKLRLILLRNLPVVARRTVDLPAMRQLCAAMAAERIEEEHLGSLVQMLTLLQHFDRFTKLRELLRQASEQHPGNAELRVLLARSQLQNGSPTPQALVELIEPLPPTAPGYEDALRWLAGVLFHLGADEQALAWYRRADEHQPLGETQRLRLQQLTARLEPNHPDAAALKHTGLRFDVEAHGAWAPALRPLAALMNLPLTHGSEPAAAEMATAAQASLQHLQGSLAGPVELPVEAALPLVRSLVMVADAALRRTATRPEAMQVPAGPAYGTLDPQRHRAVLHAVYRHVVALCEHALAREPLLQGSGQVKAVLDLATVLVEQWLALGEPAQALRSLQGLQQRMRGVGAEVLLRLAERCELEAGHLETAHEVGRRAGNGDAAQTLPMKGWADWAALQQAKPRTLLRDGARAGSFEYVRGDGEIHRVAHSVPAVELQALPVQGLVVRSSFMAADPQGHLLRPHAWHLATGEYPYKALSVISRGEAAATLTRPGRLQQISQPVVVLGNMDAIVQRHYYRWMLLTLTRVLAASEAGLLVGRRLLLPAELAPWMQESLAAIGVAQHQIKTYTRDQNLVLDDAMVLQPIEFASASLVGSLRERLLEAALGAGAPLGPLRKLLFVSRQSATSRQLVDEDGVIAVAASMGFEVIDPKQLGVLEQVKLFASAGCVVASPGAGFANLVFAPSGIRVLSLYKEDECLPTFVELSILRGQAHRWLLGRSDARFAASATARAPYRIDPDLLRRELAWVSEGAR